MIRVIAAGVAVATSLLLSPAVQADVLLIERVEAQREVVLPKRGTLMPQVEAQFGAPTRKHAPVGGDRPQHPPITRWDYPTFTVYFEHHHVVNAVVNRVNALEHGPKPVAPTQ
jgi:hypothetical protein